MLSLSPGDSARPQPHLSIILSVPSSLPIPESLATEESSLFEFFPRLQKPDLGRFPVARRLEDRRKKGDLRMTKNEELRLNSAALCIDSPRVSRAVIVEARVGSVLGRLELVRRWRRGRRWPVVVVAPAVVVVRAMPH